MPKELRPAPNGLALSVDIYDRINHIEDKILTPNMQGWIVDFLNVLIDPDTLNPTPRVSRV
ncbi:hypothetical protein [Microbulbifer epialgicus]|uniref:Uncharacterized protein n=1 Tax=Microbulbifer epialgicus TaxID=393907 RepID=A0ABV4P5B4_9GAMM